MTIHETKMIIRKWVSSCETVEQLEVLQKAIVKFFIPNLQVDIFNTAQELQSGLYTDVNEMKKELWEGIEIRKKILATPIETTPRHDDNHLNDLS